MSGIEPDFQYECISCGEKLLDSQTYFASDYKQINAATGEVNALCIKCVTDVVHPPKRPQKRQATATFHMQPISYTGSKRRVAGEYIPIPEQIKQLDKEINSIDKKINKVKAVMRTYEPPHTCTQLDEAEQEDYDKFFKKYVTAVTMKDKLFQQKDVLLSVMRPV